MGGSWASIKLLQDCKLEAVAICVLCGGERLWCSNCILSQYKCECSRYHPQELEEEVGRHPHNLQQFKKWVLKGVMSLKNKWRRYGGTCGGRGLPIKFFVFYLSAQIFEEIPKILLNTKEPKRKMWAEINMRGKLVRWRALAAHGKPACGAWLDIAT